VFVSLKYINMFKQLNTKFVVHVFLKETKRKKIKANLFEEGEINLSRFHARGENKFVE
jgi:hypothetical protein